MVNLIICSNTKHPILRFCYSRFNRSKHIQAIIDYISVNSQHIEEFQIRFLTMLRVHDFEENLINERIVKKWIKFVLVSNIHVVFLFQFPEIVSTFLEDDSFDRCISSN